ncbi:WXG100 family type VII secretion target [Streptomyces sp. NPDC002787]
MSDITADQKRENDQLIALANKIQNFHVEVSRRVTSLNTVVDMIQGGWQGAASQEYDRVQREVNVHLKKLQDNLVDLEDVMRMAVNGFEDHEQERIAEIRKVDNSAESQAQADAGMRGQTYTTDRITSLA